ncbi:sugar phosphate nucleotidyltransferase [Shigella flexneri]
MCKNAAQQYRIAVETDQSLAVGGNAVITAEAHTELDSFAKTFPGVAVCVEPESVEALVAGLVRRSCCPNTTRWRAEYANARSIRTCYVDCKMILGVTVAVEELYPVVMAGGSGWPLIAGFSRLLCPKQVTCLKGNLTMLQTTICRLNGVECESPVVICNERRRFRSERRL